MTQDTLQLLDDLNQGSGAILITDSQGHILYANKQVEKIKGFSEHEMLGKRPGEEWGGHMNESFYRKMWDHIYIQRRPFVDQVTNFNKQGDILYEKVHIAPLLNLEGEIEFFIEIDPTVHSKEEQLQFDREFLALNDASPVRPAHLMKLLSKWILKGSSDECCDTKEDYTHFMHRLFLSQNQNSKIEDKFLVEAAQHDSGAYRKLYDKYYIKIFKYFVHRISRPEEAEELSQETFVRAFGSLSHFNYQNCTYFSYLLMISHNLLVNYYRKHRPILVDDFSQISSSDAPDIYKEIELELLWKAVHELSEIEEQILRMKYLDDLSIRKIALHFNKSENAVKLILSRARKKLKNNFLS